jgi:hypothetical protein
VAEIWGSALVAGAAVVGGAAQYSASRSASRAAARGADAATAEEARQYDTTRSDLAPYRVIGNSALNRIGQIYGLDTTTPEQWQAQQDRLIGDQMLPSDARLVSTDGGRNRYYDVYLDDNLIGSVRPGGNNGRFTPAEGVDVYQLNRQRQTSTVPASSAPTGSNDFSSFYASPDYNFRRTEGMRGLERTAAARGGAFSGNALRALNEYNSNLASTEYGNYFNRLAAVAGIGQAATNSTAQAGAQYAGAAGRNALYVGDARASGIQGQANAIYGGVSDLAGAVGYYNRNRNGFGGYAPVDGYGGRVQRSNDGYYYNL